VKREKRKTKILEIYGNANEDDTIDMRDLTYVKLIFFGKKSETELADAKYDGKINPLDFILLPLLPVSQYFVFDSSVGQYTLPSFQSGPFGLQVLRTF